MPVFTLPRLATKGLRQLAVPLALGLYICTRFSSLTITGTVLTHFPYPLRCNMLVRDGTISADFVRPLGSFYMRNGITAWLLESNEVKACRSFTWTEMTSIVQSLPSLNCCFFPPLRRGGCLHYIAGRQLQRPRSVKGSTARLSITQRSPIQPVATQSNLVQPLPHERRNSTQHRSTIASGSAEQFSGHVVHCCYYMSHCLTACGAR